MKNEYTRIRRIIDDYFRMVRKLMTGEGTVPEYVLRRLKLQGKRIEGLIPKVVRYGASLFPDGKSKVRESDLKEQIEAAQIRIDLALDNLRTRMLQTAQNALASAGGVMAGAAVFAAVAAALRSRRQEFTSDWSRAAKTEMHNAKEQGSAVALYTYPDGESTLVYKVCQPTACARCIDAYQNPDGTPRIFTIGELRRNGSNADRKSGQWLPVLGCMHPHCQCTLHVAAEAGSPGK